MRCCWARVRAKKKATKRKKGLWNMMLTMFIKCFLKEECDEDEPLARPFYTAGREQRGSSSHELALTRSSQPINGTKGGKFDSSSSSSLHCWAGCHTRTPPNIERITERTLRIGKSDSPRARRTGEIMTVIYRGWTSAHGSRTGITSSCPDEQHDANSAVFV